MQLTNRKATIAGLKGDRAYSFGGDPNRRKALESVEMMTAMQEAAERSNIQEDIAQNKVSAAWIGQGRGRPGPRTRPASCNRAVLDYYRRLRSSSMKPVWRLLSSVAKNLMRTTCPAQGVMFTENR